MGAFENNYLPYTDTHRINLDWIVNRVLEYTKKVDNIEEAINLAIKDLQNQIDNLDNIYLKPDGNLIGQINGHDTECVIISISDSLSLSKTLIDAINARYGIGWVADGGLYTETEETQNVWDGGEYYNRIPAIIKYNENCIRPDYIVSNVTGE